MISIAEYQKGLEKKVIKPVNLIHGEEEYLIKNFLDRLKELYKVSILWGNELTLEDFKRAVFIAGMFGKREAVFVYRSLDFFKNVKDYRSFASLLERIREKKVFFYVETKLTEKDIQKEPFISLSKLGDVIVAGRPDKRRVKELVKNKMERYGVRIEERALDYLLEVLSYELMLLRHETDKLILYNKSPLDLEDIKAVVVTQIEMNVFDFLDGFFLKDIERALGALGASLRSGIHPLQIFALLVSYSLKLYTAKVLTEEGKRPEEALALVDIKHRFQMHSFKKYMEKNSRKELWSLLSRLYFLDVAMKVFYSDPALSLRNFVIEYILHEEGTYYQANTGDQSGSEPEP